MDFTLKSRAAGQKPRVMNNAPTRLHVTHGNKNAEAHQIPIRITVEAERFVLMLRKRYDMDDADLAPISKLIDLVKSMSRA